MKASWILLLCFAFPLGAQTAFQEARSAYDQGDFSTALEKFRSISGQSAALDYNTGNTLMRLGRNTEALAYYRRAQWQDSGDPDIRANLDQAAEKVGVELPPLPLSRRLTSFFDPMHWQTAFLLSCWLLAGTGIATLKIKTLRDAGGWIFPLEGLLMLGCAGGVWASLPSRYVHEAVVRPEEVIIRYAPLPDATEHFSLPGGTVVHVTEKSRNWQQLEVAGKKGWVPQENLWVLSALGD